MILGYRSPLLLGIKGIIKSLTFVCGAMETPQQATTNHNLKVIFIIFLKIPKTTLHKVTHHLYTS